MFSYFVSRKDSTAAASQPPSALDLALQRKSSQKDTGAELGLTNPSFGSNYYAGAARSTEKPLIERIHEDVRKEIEPVLLQDPECLTVGKRIGRGKLLHVFDCSMTPLLVVYINCS